MKILISEDDPISNRVLALSLLNWGHEVIVTRNGGEAWAALQGEDAASLAILDWMMPELDGLEICRRVRQLPSATPPYIILLTAKCGKDDVVAGIVAGANDYLTKPFHPEELRARVRVGAQIIEIQRALAERVNELEAALEEVKHLRGILPICSYCKNIRNDQNYWQRVESYISEHTEAQFTHGICPKCYECVVEPQFEELRKSKNPD